MKNQESLIIFLLSLCLYMAMCMSVLVANIDTSNCDTNTSELTEQQEAPKTPLFTTDDLDSINDKLFESISLFMPISIAIYGSLKLFRFVQSIYEKRKGNS